MGGIDAHGRDQLPLSTRFALPAGLGGLLAIMELAGIFGIGLLQKTRRDHNLPEGGFFPR